MCTCIFISAHSKIFRDLFLFSFFLLSPFGNQFPFRDAAAIYREERRNLQSGFHISKLSPFVSLHDVLLSSNDDLKQGDRESPRRNPALQTSPEMEQGKKRPAGAQTSGKKKCWAVRKGVQESKEVHKFIFVCIKSKACCSVHVHVLAWGCYSPWGMMC